MMRLVPIRILLLIVAICGVYNAEAQFYNGTKQTFGKNRPRYNQFFWTYHRASRFDIFYYQGGEEPAKYLTNFAEGEIERLESIFRKKLDVRIIFLIYNRLSDMRQGNIGLLTGKDEHNLGGTTQIFSNKVTVFFESDYSQFEQQVTAAISEILIRQILFSGSNKSFWEPDGQSNLPEWYLQGLLAFVSNGWSAKNDEMLYAISQNRKIARLNDFSTDDAKLVGQAFWFFLTQTYGLHSIPECLSYTSFYDNPIKAIRVFSGKKYTEVLADFDNFWAKRLASLQANSINDIPINPIVKIPWEREITQLGVSPDGSSMAWVMSNRGKKTLWVKDLVTNKKKKIFSTGHKLKQLQDNTFPTFCWHPNSKVIAFTEEFKGEVILHIIELGTKQYASRKFSNISKVLSLSYSPDATQIVLSAVVGGKPDIYKYSIVENRFERITDSPSGAKSPTFYGNNRRLAYISNELDESSLVNHSKVSQTLFDRAGQSIWLTARSRGKQNYTRLNHRKHEVIDYLQFTGDDSFSFLSDATGRNRLRFGSLDSTISRIDTAIHYNYSLQSKEVKLNSNTFYAAHHNQPQNIVAVFAPSGKKKVAYIQEPLLLGIEQDNTIWRRELERGWEMVLKEMHGAFPASDSLFAKRLMEQNTPRNDEMMDVFSWVFEKEKLRFLLSQHGYSLPRDDKKVNRISKIGYNVTFYPNKIVNQVDFSFLSINYQPYTGAPTYFNPGLNLNFVVGAVDLFEDYKLYGGVSFGADFESSEYLIMFEYLGGTYKHQLAFHRQSYVNFDFDEQQRVKSNEVHYLTRFPFSQVASLGGGVSFRYDNIIIPAIDYLTLVAKDDQRLWTGAKIDFIFDNANSLGFNLREGLRLKIFAETQVGLGMGKRADLYTLGADIRGYLPLWRGTILAGRFATGTSMGYAGLVYYLGSVDSWVNFNPMVPNFDQSVAVNNSEKLMFQTLATNMRGFPQNIRNGPSFSVINTEVRVPVIRMVTNRTVGSKLLSNLQLVGFFDAGSAWRGPSPWHRQNVWEEETITNGPVTITFKTQRSPLVAGFGAGLRIQTLGYPLRFDYAWGIESGDIRPPIFYFSTSIDF